MTYIYTYASSWYCGTFMQAVKKGATNENICFRSNCMDCAVIRVYMGFVCVLALAMMAMVMMKGNW